MSAPANEPPLGLDMDFNEAMSRFANTDPKEIKGDLRLKKKTKNPKKKKARGRKPQAKS